MFYYSFFLAVDPYVVIECDGNKVTSSHLTDNVNPKLNYGGLFYVKNPQSAKYKIQVECYDNHLFFLILPLCANQKIS